MLQQQERAHCSSSLTWISLSQKNCITQVSGDGSSVPWQQGRAVPAALYGHLSMAPWVVCHQKIFLSYRHRYRQVLHPSLPFFPHPFPQNEHPVSSRSGQMKQSQKLPWLGAGPGLGVRGGDGVTRLNIHNHSPFPPSPAQGDGIVLATQGSPEGEVGRCLPNRG